MTPPLVEVLAQAALAFLTVAIILWALAAAAAGARVLAQELALWRRERRARRPRR